MSVLTGGRRRRGSSKEITLPMVLTGLFATAALGLVVLVVWRLLETLWP